MEKEAVVLRTPLGETDVRSLRVGDKVRLSGVIVTARDAAHKYLVGGGKSPYELNVIYHCGPIIKGDKVISAGPTTSSREEPYMAKIIEGFGVRAIIGKGGMGAASSDAFKQYGCVYLSACGGCGASLAKRIKRILGVSKREEFGNPEAFWKLEVDGLELVVSMDSYGESLYSDIKKQSILNLMKLHR